jgi:hypothetical protein
VQKGNANENANGNANGNGTRTMIGVGGLGWVWAWAWANTRGVGRGAWVTWLRRGRGPRLDPAGLDIFGFLARFGPRARAAQDTWRSRWRRGDLPSTAPRSHLANDGTTQPVCQSSTCWAPLRLSRLVLPGRGWCCLPYQRTQVLRVVDTIAGSIVSISIDPYAIQSAILYCPD